MIVDIEVASKSIGNKTLIKDSQLKLEQNEKIGLIGGNGTGKSTLLNMICGLDKEFDGELHIKKGIHVVWARQEHSQYENVKVIEYILADLPEYSRLFRIIDSYPNLDNPSDKDLEKYSEAIERFSTLGYFEIENTLEARFDAYQLKKDYLHAPMGSLSGGQKRLVELIKLQQSNASVLIFDEPTNHMDYVAKATFLEWLKSVKASVILVSHDRDVLAYVDRIIELRDHKLHSYKGNYNNYLRTHAVKITGAVHEYEITQKRISNLKEDVIRFQRLKQKARHPGTIARFKRLEENARAELARLQELSKPTFWIDKEASSNLKSSVKDVYDKHKSKTIKINTRTGKTVTTQTLVKVDALSLGFTDPLFNDLSFALSKGERLQVVGRNGAGKSTLFKAIIASKQSQQLESTVFSGHIELHNETRIGVYEQEIAADLLDLTLGQAVEKVLAGAGMAVNEQAIKAELNKYLFDAHNDYNQKVEHLSGGQKARLQLICMLATKPNVLMLDEPTNHLDLPSIEELEQAVRQFEGAVLYISHDSYFAGAIGGQKIQI